MKLRVAGVVRESVVDGPGIRYVVFTQGCKHNCPGCHNPETHDLNGGYEVDTDELAEDIKRNVFLNGVTFSGGEPFLQAGALSDLAEKVKEQNLNIVSYSGFTFEELLKVGDSNQKKLLGMIDVLIDGKFKISERDISLKFRGSRNQRVIDVKASLKSDKPVLLYD